MREAREDFDARIDARGNRLGEGTRGTGRGRGRTRTRQTTPDDSMDMDDSMGDDMDATTSENVDPNREDDMDARATHPTIEDLLLAYLATGRVDPGVEQFLAHEFQPRDVRRLARSVDAAASKVHAALSERIAPAAQSCALRIAELRALARWRERSGAIGLDERAADVALAATESCALAAFEAAGSRRAAAARLRAFFTLLLRTQRQVAFGSPDGFGAAGTTPTRPRRSTRSWWRSFSGTGLTRDTLGDSLGSNRAAGSNPRPPAAASTARRTRRRRSRSSPPRVPPSRRRSGRRRRRRLRRRGTAGVGRRRPSGRSRDSRARAFSKPRATRGRDPHAGIALFPSSGPGPGPGPGPSSAGSAGPGSSPSYARMVRRRRVR